MRLPREPLVHFVVMGGVLFGLWSVAQRGKSSNDRPAPATPSPTVTVATADVDPLRAGFRAAWKREPTSGELADLVAGFISEEVLFRKAQALGLDRDDRVVRRRLIEKMTALARPVPSGSDPSPDQLRQWHNTYGHRFIRPALVAFDQIFFDGQRRGGDARTDATRALSSLTNVDGGADATAPPPAGLGDNFVFPERMAPKSEMELAHLFGESFARTVMAAPLGIWRGPFDSKFGMHLVRVVDRQAERVPAFEEVEKQVRADWLTVETRGLRAAAENLLTEYQIVLADDIRHRIGGEPGMAPFLRRTR